MVADLVEPLVERERPRLLAADFETVVLGGVVRGSDHHPGRVSVLADGEVERVGRDHAEVDHVGAGIADALDQRRRQERARDAHVAADDDRVRLDRGHQGPPDLPCNGGGQLLRHDPSHVVRLEQRGARRLSSRVSPSSVSVTGSSTPELKVEAPRTVGRALPGRRHSGTGLGTHRRAHETSQRKHRRSTI